MELCYLSDLYKCQLEIKDTIFRISCGVRLIIKEDQKRFGERLPSNALLVSIQLIHLL